MNKCAGTQWDAHGRLGENFEVVLEFTITRFEGDVGTRKEGAQIFYATDRYLGLDQPEFGLFTKNYLGSGVKQDMGGYRAAFIVIYGYLLYQSSLNAAVNKKSRSFVVPTHCGHC